MRESFISRIIISWVVSVVLPHILDASRNSTLSLTTENQTGFFARPLMRRPSHPAHLSSLARWAPHSPWFRSPV